MLGVTVTAAAIVAACATRAEHRITVYYAPEENFPTVIERCADALGEGYELAYRQLPRDADGQREQLVRRLAAGDSDLDILGLDVTWVPEFAEAEWIEEWTGDHAERATEGVLDAPLETARWDGALYAATKNTNVQLLWYDEALTPEPPETWDEMLKMSAKLAERGEPHQILFTGAQYEGLVVQFNTIVASLGGRIISEDGRRVVMDEQVVAGLELLARVASSGLTHPALITAQEEDVRHAFEATDSRAAFQMNWPYVYAAMREGNPERFETMRWTTYPAVREGEPARTTIGGYHIAVSSFSQHTDEAFEAALCLRNVENQKFSAIHDGVPPTIEALYTDDTPLDPSRPVDQADNPSMATAYPMRETILEALRDAAVRPLTPAYQNVSTVTSRILSPVDRLDPEAAAQRLNDELSDALELRGVLP
nr:ABC transporter substrate-binding protein [Haloechinothrix sp. LS1_15]